MTTHVDAIPEFQATFPCETITDSVVAKVITNPIGFRLPCISPAVTRVDRITHDGDSWQWNEFTMTAYHFPGQTYYHGGLLVEGHGVRLFFAGDSFTMAGIDDYCSGNRNLLGADVGYEKCLRLIQLTSNLHIFSTATSIQRLISPMPKSNICWTHSLNVKDAILHFSLGTMPTTAWTNTGYVATLTNRKVIPGETAQLRVEITNHSSEPRTATAQPILPPSWNVEIASVETTISTESRRIHQFFHFHPRALRNIGTHCRACGHHL